MWRQKGLGDKNSQLEKKADEKGESGREHALLRRILGENGQVLL